VWYKGGATLYRPFYHLQPQFCGVTFHQITKEADAGEIIHQSVPIIAKGYKIHDVGAKCVLKAQQDSPKIIAHWKKRGDSKVKFKKHQDEIGVV
jgi:folate-dependent phosphoribosylglycinamide formyltransferase PurN